MMNHSGTTSHSTATGSTEHFLKFVWAKLDEAERERMIQAYKAEEGKDAPIVYPAITL
ncbi:hypothetical protein ACYPKM_01135 [Pseudomonas aeruginosa]